MATSTPNYGFTKPAKSDLGWWATLNANFDAIDAQLAETANFVATYFPGGSLHVAGFNITNSQGAWITWNRSGNGEVNFIDHQGLAGGGFTWHSTANAAAFIELAGLTPVGTEQETTLKLGRVGGAVYSVARVYQGTVNSGGVGFRLLVVPN